MEVVVTDIDIMSDENQIVTQKGSEYNQQSFKGGMNLLLDDTRLDNTMYRIGYDLTNRYDALDPVLVSQLDVAAPKGIKQELITFGNYVIMFVAGHAYYRYYTSTGWRQIVGFSMSKDAPRFWTCAIPVSTTNYVRFAATTVMVNGSQADASGAIQTAIVAGAAAGNLPGLLVQDNENQAQFIFLDSNGSPACKTTQTFNEWSITFTDNTNTEVATDGDKREYVPIGNAMAFVDGILYIASQDGNFIYRSVSGRPLDFVVNVTNALVTMAPYTQYGGGDATTTSYSVGVGGITCLRPISTGGLFVAAGNANFAVTKNMTQNAPKEFGEYTFIRTFLFNATCLSDRVIFDTIGDTRFISLTGVRSFNAVAQEKNEGRNSPFTSNISSIFGPDTNPIVQDYANTAAILFNDYELYAVNTILGPCIAKYDTVNGCWTSFDFQQTHGKAIKILAKIELTILRLYAVTEDDQLYTLYIGPEATTPSFRTIGISSSILYAGTTIKMSHPKQELKLNKTRVILNKITEDCDCSFTPYANNRVACPVEDKHITFEPANPASTDALRLSDVDTQLMNLLFTTPDAGQAWKYFGVFSWSGGSFTQFSMEHQELLPQNPEISQGLTQ